MHRPKKKNQHSPQKPVDWLKYLDDCPPLVIPVGPRFQADVPEWRGPSTSDFDSSKRLGTRVWPVQDSITAKEGGKVGKGRPDACTCSSPGSPQCIKRHISEERSRLQSDLGSAYKSWKFDEMGEDVAKSWSWRQEKRFDSIVKTNPLSEGKSFLKPAESSFSSKTREDIVSYYLNVYVPKRISMVTRSGGKVLDSDDDEVEMGQTTPNAKSSLKRSRPSGASSTKLAKSHYLTGRR